MRFATFKLIGEAERWWRSTKAILEGMDTEKNPITWEKFKGVFYDNCFLEVVRERKEREFADLVQVQLLSNMQLNSLSYLTLDPT